MRQDYFFVSAPTGEENDSVHPLSVNCGGYCELSPGSAFNLPRGRRDYTLFYLHEGRFRIAFGERRMQELVAGAIILIPPNATIRYENPGDTHVSIYWTHFSGYDVGSLFRAVGVAEVGSILPLKASASSAEAFQRFLDEMKNPPNEATKLRAAAALVLLLTTLVRLSEDTAHVRRLAYTFAYMQEHFTEDIPMEALAEKEKLGVSQFHVVFRALTGMTPTQYITKLRMSLAARLLRDATLSVGEVAEACGYGDMFYFSRVFRREMGVSPSAYHKGTP